MPVVLTIELELAAPPPGGTSGRGAALHGLVHRALGRLESGLGDAIHDAGQGGPVAVKPFALGLGRARANRLAFSVRVLDDALGDLFAAALAPGTPLPSGYTLEGRVAALRREDHPYAALEERHLAGPPPSLVELDFLSPTAVSAGDRDAAFPLPGPLWTGLARRWGVPGRPGASDRPLAADPRPWLLEHVACVGYELRSVRVLAGKRAVLGCVGRARYRLLGDADGRRVAGLLAAYARFAGVGVRTSWGLGEVRARLVPDS